LTPTVCVSRFRSESLRDTLEKEKKGAVGAADAG
jgi:hypothetical protein